MDGAMALFLAGAHYLARRSSWAELGIIMWQEELLWGGAAALYVAGVQGNGATALYLARNH